MWCSVDIFVVVFAWVRNRRPTDTEIAWWVASRQKEPLLDLVVAPDNSPTTAKPAQDLLPLDAPPIPDNTPTAVAEPAPGMAGGNPDGVEKVLFEQPYAEALPFGAQWEDTNPFYRTGGHSDRGACGEQFFTAEFK